MHNYSKIGSKQNTFDIDWNLGTICNYECSYCIPHLHNGKNPFVDISKAKSFVRDITDRYPDKVLNFILSGGEVTLWKHLPDLFKTIKEKESNNIQLISNGSIPNVWWNINSRFIDALILSYHWEYADKNKLKELCRIVDQNNCNIKLIILALPDRIDMCYKLAKEFLSHVMMKVELRIIKKPDSSPIDEYTDDQLKLLRKNNLFGHFKHKTVSHQLVTNTGRIIDPIVEILNQTNSWKGWKCNIGLECLKIDWQGNIYRASCKDQSSSKLGNVNNGNFVFSDEPVICDKDFCFCVTDIRATKERLI